jgi:hypothetical protein
MKVGASIILVYATASVVDAKALRARNLITRAMRTGWIRLYFCRLFRVTTKKLSSEPRLHFD